MRKPRRPPGFSISIRDLLLLAHVLLCWVPGTLSSRIVTLGSIQIWKTHEWFPATPIVYFRCQGENKTYLPDVKEKDISYTFNGEESWQPLTELPEKKCKRCGVYEEDSFKADDIFDEWELCSGNFADGKYMHSKVNEFNATFLCPECHASDGSNQAFETNEEASGKKGNIVMVIFISILASISMFAAMVGLYKYWQKRKREKDQARFLKLFEESDDIEDELGLSV